MKISCTQENLTRGLTTVAGITGRNTTLPILNNVLLKTEDGLLRLTTTNLEVGVSCVVRGKIEEAGQFTVDARVLSDYVNLMPHDKVDLHLKDGELVLVGKDSDMRVKGLPADDFPLIPQVEKKDPFIVTAEDFKKALAQTVFAISQDEARPEINGGFIRFLAKEVVVVATDSYRLAEKKIPLQRGGGSEQTVIVPLRTLQELAKILNSFNQEELEIYVTENQILFALDEVELVSRIIEGQFPDYEQIIPKVSTTQVKIEVGELVKLVKRVSVFCRSGINDLRLKLHPTKKEVIFLVTNQQLGENQAVVSAELTGEELEIVFNYRYLLDGLVNIGADEVVISFNGGEAPGLLKPVGDESYSYIVMPIRN